MRLSSAPTRWVRLAGRWCRDHPLTLGSIAIGTSLAAIFVPSVTSALGPSCEERAAIGYPEMATEINSLLGGIDYTTSRGDSCPFTMEPVTYLTATVPDWQRRSEANQHFLQRGWRVESATATSPDGKYSINIVVTIDSEHSTRHIDLVATESADRSD